jgi:hypothetical protein
MKKEELENKLENLALPEINSGQHKDKLRLTILNMSRSHKMGYAFVIIPLLFLFGICLTRVLDINIPIVNTIEQLMARWDNVAYLKLIFPIVYLVLPFIALVVNLLASLHFSWNSRNKELNILYRFRWGNFIIIIISVFILTTFFIYLIMENS